MNIYIKIMGQKINPLCFRLGTPQQNHYSIWFAQTINYSESLQEDKKIRDYLNNYVQKKIKIYSNYNLSNIEGIKRIDIKKHIDFIKIIIYIYIRFTKELLENSLFKINELEINIQKELNLKNNKYITIILKKIKNPYKNPQIIAAFIAEQLKNRVSFVKAIKKVIQLAEKEDIKGIQIKISGRLGGKRIARIQRIKEGKVPLQTIRAKIDYCSYNVRTPYGILGLKIWICIQ